MISSFRDKYSFLSNFYLTNVPYGNLVYPSSEHAFQAAKSFSSIDRRYICSLKTPGEAKKAGRSIILRIDWDKVKIKVMRKIVVAKFMNNTDIAIRLVNTGDQELIEGNTWGDNFWGSVKHDGTSRNELGKILMKLREKLQCQLNNIEK